jgi:hypothetical protein
VYGGELDPSLRPKSTPMTRTSTTTEDRVSSSGPVSLPQADGPVYFLAEEFPNAQTDYEKSSELDDTFISRW